LLIGRYCTFTPMIVPKNDSFKSGFVSIIGKPNVGKSTLMNSLTGEQLSITTNKAQTTRHRIFGIITTAESQIVYSDTPGTLDPSYKLQEKMMKFVKTSLEDADVILYIVELGEKKDETGWLDIVKSSNVPVIFLINKIDTAKGSQILDKETYWQELHPELEIMPVSALEKINLDKLHERVLELLPIHPPYFPEDELTDKSERFITAEIIREKIFLLYKQEIPYSSEVVVTSFKEEEKIIRLEAEIFVERNGQKGIIIGNKGEAIKQLGIAARESLEKFFGKQIYLETRVKVEKDWRKQDRALKKFGY